jgi:hypothetical protein
LDTTKIAVPDSGFAPKLTNDSLKMRRDSN